MRQAFVDICGVPTNVATWGQWVGENSPEGDPENIALFIPGNPGVLGFYHDFLKVLHQELQFPVWAVAHAGFEEPPEEHRKTPPLLGNETLYGLKGQLEAKREFIKKYVPAGAKLHLIGHSIGSYLILNLLDDPEINAKVAHCYFLFPTIEDMAVAPHGKYLTTYIDPISSFLYSLLWLFNCLPYSVRYGLLYCIRSFIDIPKKYVGTVVELFSHQGMYIFRHMGMEEMHLVKDRQDDLVSRFKDKLKLYYGTTDHWVPVDYYYRLKKQYPDIDAELCTQQYTHCFVFESSVEVALMVAGWVRKKMHTVK